MGERLMVEIFQVIFMLWCLFMVGGAMVLMTYMMWNVLRSVFEGEW
jgi:hypothetical protein